MNIRDRQIELLTPVLRGLIAAAIHVSVCLVASRQAAVTPNRHYFAYLYIDMLQNESVLLGCFVALSSYSIVLRGIVGIFGAGLLICISCVSTVAHLAEYLPLAMFFLTLAGIAWGGFLRICGATLRPATSRTSNAPQMQFTLKHLMLASAVTCWMLTVARETELMSIPVAQIDFKMPDPVVLIVFVHTVLIAIPTILVTCIAALGTLRSSPDSTCILSTAFFALVGALATALLPPAFSDLQEYSLWLTETPLHMLMAMWLFRWMGLRFNE